LIAVLASTVLARADGPADALVAEGIALRERGKDEEALERFRQADALQPTPRTRAQIALAEQALGYWVPAEEHLIAALAKADDPWIAKNRAALDGALETIKKHLATLEVRGDVPNAEVLVDGKRIGSLPITARVEAGARTLLVRAPGYHATSRAVQVSPGSTARETIELTRATADEGKPGDRAVILSTEGGTQRTLGWVAVGVGGALVALGVVGVVARQAAVSAYNDDRSCPGLGSATQPPQCADKVSRADTWQTLSIVGLAGGGVLVAGGVVLLLTAPTAPVQTRIACGVQGSGVGCAGVF
jgi:hypothetical protein